MESQYARNLTRLPKILIVLSLTLSLGAHWMFLQSVAWVGMVVNFSQDAPIGAALAKTFSGTYPCDLCKVVNEGKASEQKQDISKSVAKLDLACFAGNALLNPPPPFPHVAGTLVSFFSLTHAPPTPPPKAA